MINKFVQIKQTDVQQPVFIADQMLNSRILATMVFQIELLKMEKNTDYPLLEFDEGTKPIAIIATHLQKADGAIVSLAKAFFSIGENAIKVNLKDHDGIEAGSQLTLTILTGVKGD